MTQHRRIVGDDGTEMQIEPDLKAIQQVLSIMDRRTKLLGMEQTNVNVNVDGTLNQTVRATIAGQPGVTMPAVGFDAESEARKLLELMAISGVLPEETVYAILRKNQEDEGLIIDAEVVSDSTDEPNYRDPSDDDIEQ
jgi:hypothetical protein